MFNKHLHCVINTPGLHGGVALVVNLFTCVRESDAACILKPGDHEWIKHDSFVDYNFAKCVAVGDLVALTKPAPPRIYSKPTMRSDVLARIIAGAKKSKFLAPKFLAYLD